MPTQKAKTSAFNINLEDYFQTNEIFKNAFQYSAIGMALVSLDGKWLKVNPRVCDIVGYSENELLKLTFHEITHPQDLNSDLSYVKQVLEGKIETYNKEKRYIHKNGGIVWVLLSVSLAKDAEKNPLFFISQIEDITERKNANDKLIASEKRHRSFFNDSPIPLWEEDLSEVKKRLDLLKQKGISDFRAYFASHPDAAIELASFIKVLDVNQAALKMYAANSKEELLADLATSSTGEVENNPDDFVAIAEGKTSNHWDGADETLSGEPIKISLSWSVVPGHEHDYSKVIVTTFDITERKQVQEELQKSEERYRKLFEDSPISLWEDDYSAVKQKLDELKNEGITDFKAYFAQRPEKVKEFASLVKIVDANQYSVKLFNAKNKADLLEYSRKSIAVGFIDSHEFVNIAKGITHFEWEGVNRKLSGELMNIKLTWSVALGYEDDLSKVIISIIDTTEQKQAENERRILIQELGDRVKELTFLHNISRIFMDDSRPENEVMQAVVEMMPSAWQYPEVAVARIGFNGSQFTTPNFKQTDWMLSQFFDYPGGNLGVVQVSYLEERPQAEEGPFLREERYLLESTAEKLQTYLKGFFADRENNRQLTELETLYESGLAISQLLTPKEIAQEVIGVLERRMNWHHISIREYYAESNSVKLIGFSKPNISANEAKEHIKKMNRLISNPTQGLSGWVTVNGKSIRVSNVKLDDRYIMTFPEIESGIYIPLKVGERVIGSISVESEIENAFSEHDERLLETLAGQAAIAIENANLFGKLQSELIQRQLIEDEVRQFNAELEKRVEERTFQIESTKRRLELATHAGHIGVWEYSPRENKVIWDERMHSIHHLPVGAFGGTAEAWAKYIHPQDLEKSQMNIQLAFTQNLLLNNEHRILWDDGTIRTIATSAVTVFSEDNTPDRIIGISIDITDRKKSEEALKLANAEMENALKVKDEFLANMSHELRTPLNAILGISESLEEQVIGNLNEKQSKYVGIIKESGRHLLELINDILDISKIEAGRMELDFRPVRVEKLCQASLRMIKELALKKSLHVSFKIHGEVKTILGDERRLKQVLVNLLSNAVKFTETGKQIGLEVTGYSEVNEVVFAVWDTGIGIPQEDLKYLFKPFVQLDGGLNREFQGTGLGLALVAQMIRLHGGNVSVHSEAGTGSRFTFTLPWHPEEQNTPVKVTGELVLPNQNPEEKRKGKILLIEDTDVIIALMREYLTYKGYEVFVAHNGKDGIRLAKENLPDIILMDVMMPIMDGLEATKEIRRDSSLKNIPIIALTALAMIGDRERCFEAGMTDYMSKPVKLNELTEIIEKYLQRGIL